MVVFLAGCGKATYTPPVPPVPPVPTPNPENVMLVPADPTCPDNATCPETAGFWVRRSKVRDIDESACIVAYQKESPPSPQGIIEFPLPETICKVTRATQLDGVVYALKP